MNDTLQPTLVIGNKNYSSWSLRPWLLMQHFGIGFAEQQVWLDTPEMPAQMADLHSDARVPVLIDGDYQVWDSLAIIEYVADAYALVDAWPLDIKARGVARAMAAEMHSSFDALRRTMPMNIRRSVAHFEPDAATKADIERVHTLWLRARRQYAGRASLDDGWLFGQFSAVDAMFAPVVSRFQTYGVSGDTLIDAYCARVLAHPAMRAWTRAALEETQIVEADEV